MKSSNISSTISLCLCVPQEQAIAMTVLMMTILGPSGWILAHLEDYKKK
uniref:Uncharacterized protein n=1 Tax=Seriola lalandi dorsalis TaxID=1841481 RepID=A0A3B4XWR0_SERLL